MQIAVRHLESGLEIVTELGPRMARAVEVVLVLDAHRARVAQSLQDGEELRPVDRSKPRQAIAPPLRAIHRIDAAAPQNIPPDLRVLQVNIVDLVGEIARGLDR